MIESLHCGGRHARIRRTLSLLPRDRQTANEDLLAAEVEHCPHCIADYGACETHRRTALLLHLNRLDADAAARAVEDLQTCPDCAPLLFHARTRLGLLVEVLLRQLPGPTTRPVAGLVLAVAVLLIVLLPLVGAGGMLASRASQPEWRFVRPPMAVWVPAVPETDEHHVPGIARRTPPEPPGPEPERPAPSVSPEVLATVQLPVTIEGRDARLANGTSDAEVRGQTASMVFDGIGMWESPASEPRNGTGYHRGYDKLVFREAGVLGTLVGTRWVASTPADGYLVIKVKDGGVKLSALDGRALDGCPCTPRGTLTNGVIVLVTPDGRVVNARKYNEALPGPVRNDIQRISRR